MLYKRATTWDYILLSFCQTTKVHFTEATKNVNNEAKGRRLLPPIPSTPSPHRGHSSVQQLQINTNFFCFCCCCSITEQQQNTTKYIWFATAHLKIRAKSLNGTWTGKLHKYHHKKLTYKKCIKRKSKFLFFVTAICGNWNWKKRNGMQLVQS